MKNSKCTNRCIGLPRQLFLAILLSVLALGAYAQNRTVSGNVTDTSGEPVTGASIREKGSNNGTITDLDGRFTLTIRSETTLTVSYIGFKTQEVSAIPGKSLNIVLQEDTEILDEVIIVGFGTQKKVNLTGAVGTAEAKDLESRPVTSATQALQGLVPGLNISSSTGELDKGMDINIRGTGTIGDGSSGAPLVLIDGMESDLNTVNPQDIETISVLKDAAASSIYGSRAPFGVILVTTKSGKAGKVSINYNNNFRVSNPLNMPESMDSYSFAVFSNFASANNGGAPIFTDEVMQKMLDFQAGKLTGGLVPSSNGQWGKPDHDPFTTAFANTDWYKEIYKSSTFSQEHNVSLTGGTEKQTYYASFNYLDQNGLLRQGDDGMERYNVTAKINSELTPWLKFNANIRFTRTDNHRPTYFGGNFYGLFGPHTWPNLPVYDPNGYYFNNNATNPAQNLAEGGKRKYRTDQHYYQGAFLIEPMKNWVTHLEFNYAITDASKKKPPCQLTTMMWTETLSTPTELPIYIRIAGKITT